MEEGNVKVDENVPKRETNMDSPSPFVNLNANPSGLSAPLSKCLESGMHGSIANAKRRT